MNRFALLLLLPVGCVAQTARNTAASSQVSTANCSPNIVSSGSGRVNVQFNGCNGADPRLVKELTQNIQKFIAQFPKTIANLNELLDRKNVELADMTQQVEDWTKRYKELTQRLEEQPSNDEMSKKASVALNNGDLAGAESLLKESLLTYERQVDRSARAHFNLGQVYILRAKPLAALSEYEVAYRYRPEEDEYAVEYAGLLVTENRQPEGEAILLHTIADLSRVNSSGAKHLARVAQVRIALAVIYDQTNRLPQAETEAMGALSIYKELFDTEPNVYSSYVAKTLLTLGTIRGDMFHRGDMFDPDGQESATKQGLEMFKELATKDPAQYLPHVADSVDSLGSLYFATEQFLKAEQSLDEALARYESLARYDHDSYSGRIASVLSALCAVYNRLDRTKYAKAAGEQAVAMYERLADENADSYRPFLATTLLNLGVVYHRLTMTQESVSTLTRAVEIFREAARKSPAVFSDMLSRSLYLLAASLALSSNVHAETVCATAKEAVQVALSTAVRLEATKMAGLICDPTTQ